MRHRGGFSEKERRARSRLTQIANRERFVYGSIVTSERKCGKANCWCKEEKGRGHVSSYLSVRLANNRRRMIFIPQLMIKKVRAWTQIHKEITRQIVAISESCLARIREE